MRKISVLTVLSLCLSCMDVFAAKSAAEPILNCWDGTFAYTQAKVSEVEGQSNLFDVVLQSQQQKFLQNILPTPVSGWGEGRIQFYVWKKNCQHEEGFPHLMKCETHDGNIRISYRENPESERTLTLAIKDLKFQTSLVNDSVQADLSFIAGSQSLGGPVTFRFPGDESKNCRMHFH